MADIQDQQAAEAPLEDAEESVAKSEIESVLQDSAGADDESIPTSTSHGKRDTKPLTAQVAAKGISLLAKTGNGLSYAYTKLELHALELTGIDILQHYPHLRYIVS